MEESILKLLMDKPIIIPKIIFNNYKKLNITEEEFIILIYIINMGNKIVYNPDIFVKELNIEKFRAMELINSLSEKKLISLSIEKNSNNLSEEYITLDLLYNKLLNMFMDKKEETKPNDIYSIFEAEFARTLTPMEYELISTWLEDNYSKDMIIEALREAILNNVTNLNYIDKILHEWRKKGIVTKNDIIKEKNEFRSNNRTINMSIYDCDWLNDE